MIMSFNENIKYSKVPLDSQKCAIVLTWNVLSIALSDDSRNFLPVTMPALLIKIETSPTLALTF